MASEGQGSVTLWVGDLKAGGDGAAEGLWRRYFEALVRLARAELRAIPRTAADEEDVALSAFDSFCAGVPRGRFPRLDDRDDLWRVLVTITARKAADLVKRERARKRGGGRVRLEADLVGAGPAGEASPLALVGGPEPTPDFAAMVAEEFRRRLAGLRDETLRRVALLKMECYTVEEVAERLGYTPRTVARKLVLIRKAWAEEGGS